MSNPFAHIEFHVKDARKAVEWYGKVFGWEANYNEDMKYGLFKAGDGRLNGGLADNANLSGTVPYIGTDDIPGMLDRVKAAAGTVIMPETPIPGYGAFGIFSDPDGNTLAFYKGNGAEEPEKSDLPHPIVHVEVQCKDMNKAARWYGDLLGWEMTAFPEMSYTAFQTGQKGIGGGINPDENAEPGALVYVEARDRSDLDDMLAKTKANGGSVVSEPFETPGVAIFAFVADPDGNRIGLMKPENTLAN